MNNMKDIETKREKFVRLAESRTLKAVQAIENIVSLSNPRSYDYDENDIKKILGALREATNEVQDAFKSKEKKIFKL